MGLRRKKTATASSFSIISHARLSKTMKIIDLVKLYNPKTIFFKKKKYRKQYYINKRFSYKKTDKRSTIIFFNSPMPMRGFPYLFSYSCYMDSLNAMLFSLRRWFQITWITTPFIFNWKIYIRKKLLRLAQLLINHTCSIVSLGCETHTQIYQSKHLLIFIPQNKINNHHLVFNLFPK